MCVLYVIAFLLWGTSNYVANVTFSQRRGSPRYACLEAEVAAASGSTSCSTAALCAKEGLFINHRYAQGEWFNLAMIVFVIMSLIAWAPILGLSALSFHQNGRIDSKFVLRHLYGGHGFGGSMTRWLIYAIAALGLVMGPGLAAPRATSGP